MISAVLSSSILRTFQLQLEGVDGLSIFTMWKNPHFSPDLLIMGVFLLITVKWAFNRSPPPPQIRKSTSHRAGPNILGT